MLFYHFSFGEKISKWPAYGCTCGLQKRKALELSLDLAENAFCYLLLLETEHAQFTLRSVRDHFNICGRLFAFQSQFSADSFRFLQIKDLLISNTMLYLADRYAITFCELLVQALLGASLVTIITSLLASLLSSLTMIGTSLISLSVLSDSCDFTQLF